MRVQPCSNLDKYLKTPYKEIWQIGNATGLRISDIIKLKFKDLKKEKPTITETKTGKSKRIYIPKKARIKLLSLQKNQSDESYVFSSTGKTGHITRQAVHKAFKKAAKKAHENKNIGTHTMRKNYALRQYNRGKGLKYVQKKLNHEQLAETMLYLIEKE